MQLTLRDLLDFASVSVGIWQGVPSGFLLAAPQFHCSIHFDFDWDED